MMAKQYLRWKSANTSVNHQWVLKFSNAIIMMESRCINLSSPVSDSPDVVTHSLKTNACLKVASNIVDFFAFALFRILDRILQTFLKIMPWVSEVFTSCVLVWQWQTPWMPELFTPHMFVWRWQTIWIRGTLFTSRTVCVMFSPSVKLTNCNAEDLPTQSTTCNV